MTKRTAVSIPLLALFLSLPLAAAAAALTPVVVTMDHPDSWDLASTVSLGGTLRLEAVPLGDQAEQTLRLERFRVFSPGARIVVHGPAGDSTVPAPGNLYFRGAIEGDPASSAFLTVRQRGDVRGLITSGGKYWLMASELGPGVPPTVRAIDTETELAEQTAGFSCATDQLPEKEDLDKVFPPALSTFKPAETAASGDKSAAYTARLAIETDVEFYQLFGNAADAADYVGDLVAYSSGVYAAEVATSLEVSSISLWSGGTDPWTQGPGYCSLLEFGRYWNDHHGGEERTIAHYLSGKPNGGGIAWSGVLCSQAFNYDHLDACPGLTPRIDNYGGAYGHTSNITGSFDLQNPTAVWDIVAFAHEIGHNFNSRHSHCYGGLGGNPDPVDGCYAGQCGQGGCFCGEQSLPCAEPGAGCGTLMSYCHFRTGGLGNISLTFGAGHPWGVEPERIPSRMFDHVEAQAAANPGCLDLVTAPGALFSDGFETGDTSIWAAAAQ